MQRLAIIVPWRDERDLTPTLAALTALNVELIKLHKLPPLYEMGVRYRGENYVRDGSRRKEHWLTAPVLFESGSGDCEDLATCLAAGYRVSGKDPDAIAIARRNSIGGYHIVVQRGDGRIEDPSKVLGMGRG